MNGLRGVTDTSFSTYSEPSWNTTSLDGLVYALATDQIHSSIREHESFRRAVPLTSSLQVSGDDFSISHETEIQGELFSSEIFVTPDDHGNLTNEQYLLNLQEALITISHDKTLSPLQREWLVEEILAKNLAYTTPNLDREILIPNRKTGFLEVYHCITVNIFATMPMFILEPKENNTSPPYVVFRGTSCLAGIYADAGIDAVRNGIGTGPFNHFSPALEPIFTALHDRFGKFNVCGHSLGGSLTMLSAIRFPHLIRKASAFNAPKVSEKNAEEWRSIQGQKPILWVTNPKGDMVADGGSYKIGTYITFENERLSELSDIALHGVNLLQGKGRVIIEKEGCWSTEGENIKTRIVKILTDVFTVPLKLFGALFISAIYQTHAFFQKTAVYLFDTLNCFRLEKEYPDDKFIDDLMIASQNADSTRTSWDRTREHLVLRANSITPPRSPEISKEALDIANGLLRDHANSPHSLHFEHRFEDGNTIYRRTVSDPGLSTKDQE